MRDLTKVLNELKGLQDEYKGKPMPEDVGAKFSALAKEASEMQAEADRKSTIESVERMEAKSREIADQPIPDTKTERPRDVVGYLTLGDAVAFGSELKEFMARGMPKGQVELLSADVSPFKRKGRKMPAVALGKEAYAALQQKAPPTIGARVIPWDRDNDLVLSEEYVQPRIRDLLNIVQTNSNNVEWVRRNSRTRGAATQSETITEGVQGLKGQHANAYELVSTPIRTHAVWQPVTEQQLSDWPQISQLIQGDLLDDLNQYFEEQVMYGDGLGTNFNGFFEGSNVGAAREESGDTLIDVIRRGITDIRRAQLQPNGIVMDPIDWENVVLTKGDDEHYVWVVVTENNVPRIWGLPVVETVKAENVDDGERNVLIGDFQRGATLYDRQSLNVSVGWIDDQFVRNMRTILMEARAGFAIRRPDAFRKINTAEATS
jgi:HK97 family phage major capsid protein